MAGFWLSSSGFSSGKSITHGWNAVSETRIFLTVSYFERLEAFQVSLLAGRVLIKDFRYHSRNQSIRILKLNVTWRYWIWRTQTKEDVKNDDTGGEASQGGTVINTNLGMANEVS